MVSKATVKKESPKQSLTKITLEAAVRRCSSKQVLLETTTLFKRDFKTGVFLRTLQNFYEQLFYRIPPVAAFVSLIKQG